jgi:UDP-N-acetylmuramoylalanine--D-glutamate ligase
MRAGRAQYAQAAVTNLGGKRVMVLGLGISGRAAARFAAAHGASLVLTDTRIDIARDGLPQGELHLGAESEDWLHGVDFIVASPGVPPTSALLRAARASAIPVMGELELASQFITAPMVAVTGTNGKSTVTMLAGEIFKAAGMKTFVGGNLGTPLIEAAQAEAAQVEFDAAVVEVSSYQLETIATFKPKVAIHLNLSEDHLDRYRDLNEYGRAKARIFENQDASDWAILNRDDPEVWKLAGNIRSRVFSFGTSLPAKNPAIWFERGALVFDDGRRRGRIGLDDFKLPGRHNLSNAMAAAAAALALDVDPLVIERAFERFSGLPHRTEFVCEKDGVAFIDDSKGTNVGAVIEALAGVRGPVILIAGGTDKGGDYAPLRAPLVEKVRLLILIGAAREKMRAALEGATTIAPVPTLSEAVRLAASVARRGDSVLLSPACSSFDQFKDYAERGRIFQELVRAL